MIFQSVRVKCEKILYENQKVQLSYYSKYFQSSGEFQLSSEFSLAFSRSIGLSQLEKDIPLQVVHTGARERHMHQLAHPLRYDDLIIFKRFSSAAGLFVDIDNNKSLFNIQPSLFSFSAHVHNGIRVKYEDWQDKMFMNITGDETVLLLLIVLLYLEQSSSSSVFSPLLPFTTSRNFPPAVVICYFDWPEKNNIFTLFSSSALHIVIMAFQICTLWMMYHEFVKHVQKKCIT